MAPPRSLLKGFEKVVETVRPDPNKRLVIYDEATTGLCLLVSPRGRKTFTIVARRPDGKQVWKEVAKPGEMELVEVRAKAREGVKRIKEGLEPFPPAAPAPEPTPARTFKQEAESFLDLYVRKKALRSTREVERTFERLVYPGWSERPFESIRRRDVAELLDKVAEERGPVMARRLLARLSKLFNWYAARSDDYVSPIVRDMGKQLPEAAPRERILSHDEIRQIWAAADQSGSFGAFIKTLLLTAQRRAKVATMRRGDIADGLWTIPAEAREKQNAGELPLSKMVLDIIKAQPRVEGNEFVFPGNGKLPMSGFSPLKKVLDEKIAEANDGKPLARWTLHDLRRTARSLMSDVGVPSDDAERVLGHKIKGVEGTYNRSKHIEQKRLALRKLAAEVGRILNPPENNVVRLRGARR